MHKFTIRVTDTYGGDANFSWVREYTYKAKNMRGAINKLAREYGAGWRKAYDTGNESRYNLAGACICCFVSTDWV